MDFKLFNKDGVFQPIEFIIAFLYFGIIYTVASNVLLALELYLPWWTEINGITNGGLTFTIVWCCALLLISKGDKNED